MALIITIAACSDDGEGGSTGNTGNTAGNGGSTSGADGGGTAGTATDGSAGSSGSSATAGSGGSSNPNECQLQGAYHADTDATLRQMMCRSLPAYSTVYNLTVNGTSIRIEQYVERFPMTGTIDAQCNVSVVVQSPIYREFNLSLNPAAMTGSGTLVDANTSDCRSTYDLAMTLQPGHR